MNKSHIFLIQVLLVLCLLSQGLAGARPNIKNKPSPPNKWEAQGTFGHFLSRREAEQIPETSETPETSVKSESPDTPETLKTPETPETLQTPLTPETQKTPETPLTPETLKTPETPKTIDARSSRYEFTLHYIYYTPSQ